MEPTKENIIKAHNIAKATGADSTCKVLEALYPDMDFTPKDNRPVTERIKTFEDALAELDRRANGKHPLVSEFEGLQGYFCDNDSMSADVLAYLELRIVCAALNEGWEPKHTEDEVRYYPWHWLYTQDEIDDMDCDERNNRNMMSVGEYETQYAGFACADSSYAPSHSAANIGSRLCLKSRDLAIYCGKQFIDLWADFKLIRR